MRTLLPQVYYFDAIVSQTTPPPPRSGQLKRDFNWSIRCVRKILQQEMWRTNIGWTFGELWQISESYYLSKVKCVKTISIHNLQNYGWFSIKFKGAILWKSLRAGSRKDKEKIWTDAVIDAVVVTLSNFRKLSGIALVLHYLAIWLVQKNSHNFLDWQDSKLNTTSRVSQRFRQFASSSHRCSFLCSFLRFYGLLKLLWFWTVILF